MNAGFTAIKNGASCVFGGGLKRYLVLPIIIQLTIYVIVVSCANKIIFSIPFISSSLDYINTNYNWAYYVFYSLIFIPTLIFSGFFTSIISPIVLSPFLEPYAQRILLSIDEKHNNQLIETSVKEGIIREIKKLPYFLKISAIILICTICTPFFLGITGIIAVCLSAWVIVAEYMDLIASMHGVNFESVKDMLRKDRYSAISMGLPIVFLATLPVLNLFVPLIATASSCNLWMSKKAQV